MDLSILIAMLTVAGLPVGYYIAKFAKTEVRQGAAWIMLLSKVLTAVVLFLFILPKGIWTALLWAAILLAALLMAKVQKVRALSLFLIFFVGLLMGLMRTDAILPVVASLVFLDCLAIGSLAFKKGAQRLILDGIALLFGILAGALL